MTLIVEDSTGLPDAESYLSVIDADTYWVKRNYQIWATFSQSQKEAALRQATSYIDGTYSFKGIILNISQALSWPRQDVFDYEGRPLTGIPQKLKDACAELALKTISAPLLEDVTRDATVKRQKVGTLEVEYFEGAFLSKSYPYIDLLLKGIGENTGARRRLQRT